ncbi:MAG TPA: apolipoprotein N-acyltransferase [Steroidobacteraceae bacterium]|jgi:apolipoprotein N-acyltransferase|nr:apolipoprotein N-acyltransferase [Steroidobacteraceae bacterium]
MRAVSAESAVAAARGARYSLVRPASALARALLALLAGAALAAAFAPLDLWPLAVLSPALLMWLWQGATPREAARLGFWFSFATFAAGTYWLYISIHGFGGAPVWLAGTLMLGLVSIMGLYHAALGYVAARWLPAEGALRWLVALPAAWLLMEWWRGWFLSGFSWLSLGYSQTDTWLAAFAPLAGVYGISALLLLGAGALTMLACAGPRTRICALLALLVPWAAGAALHHHSWTHASGPAVSVAVVQGAIPQDEKWLESNRDTTLHLYRTLTERVLGNAIIVWPESAPADIANDIAPYINSLYRDARAHGSAVVMGVLRAEQSPAGGTRYFNSVLALDARQVNWYDKHHLVPFAEFFPVPQFVRSWMRLMSLPYSDFTRGAADQPPLPAAHLQLGTTVCYEDAYGSSMLEVLPHADALVNVTNDAWFGHSSARHQHLQIARMRALEEGRFLVRAANDGISAVIGPHGEVIARAPEFVPATLVSAIVPYAGLPPYAHVGNWLVVSLATVALAYGLAVRNDRRLRRRQYR